MNLNSLKFVRTWKAKRYIEEVNDAIAAGSKQLKTIQARRQIVQELLDSTRSILPAEGIFEITAELTMIDLQIGDYTKTYYGIVERGNILTSHFQQYCRDKSIVIPPGHILLKLSDFFLSKKTQQKIIVPLISDIREEYNEALLQNHIWKARWVRIRGTYSFFAAIGLDRAFAFVSFFIKAWKSVN